MLDLSKYNQNTSLKIVIGAGEQKYDGWISTQKDDLDLTNEEHWIQSFSVLKADRFLCEHVFEHLTLMEGQEAAKWLFNSLRPGGKLRVSVPDLNFPSKEYQVSVQVGGPGPLNHPAADHKIVYDYRLFTSLFKNAGFDVNLLEFCDEKGRFHFNYWHPSDGFLYRTLRFDHRNRDGELGFVSIALDCIRPK